MARKYSYYPAKDGGKALPGTEKLADLCARRWKATNMGIYSARLMRNSKTEGKKIGDPGMENYVSVHATGAAVDLGYPDRKTGLEMWNWFIKYTKELGIEEIECNLTEPKNESEAKEIALLDNNSFGKVIEDKLVEFIKDTDIVLEDFVISQDEITLDQLVNREEIDFDNIEGNNDRKPSDKKQEVKCPFCNKLFEF